MWVNGFLVALFITKGLQNCFVVVVTTTSYIVVASLHSHRRGVVLSVSEASPDSRRIHRFGQSHSVHSQLKLKPKKKNKKQKTKSNKNI